MFLNMLFFPWINELKSWHYGCCIDVWYLTPVMVEYIFGNIFWVINIFFKSLWMLFYFCCDYGRFPYDILFTINFYSCLSHTTKLWGFLWCRIRAPSPRFGSWCFLISRKNSNSKLHDNFIYRNFIPTAGYQYVLNNILLLKKYSSDSFIESVFFLMDLEHYW